MEYETGMRLDRIEYKINQIHQLLQEITETVEQNDNIVDVEKEIEKEEVQQSSYEVNKKEIEE